MPVLNFISISILTCFLADSLLQYSFNKLINAMIREIKFQHLQYSSLTTGHGPKLFLSTIYPQNSL